MMFSGLLLRAAPYVIAAGAAAVAGAYGSHVIWSARWDRHQAKDATQREAAAMETLRIERQYLNRIETAEANHAKATQVIDRERNRADATSKRLRDHLAASVASGKSTDSVAACRERAATCWELFVEADATAGAMAQAADQHANEVKLLLDAWPGDSGN